MKERITLKRITSILLTLVLMVGLLPTVIFSVSAADVQEVSTYEALVAAAELGGEIKLTGNIELEDTVLVSNAETTLDLNGYTMSLNDPEMKKLPTAPPPLMRSRPPSPQATYHLTDIK